MYKSGILFISAMALLMSSCSQKEKAQADVIKVEVEVVSESNAENGRQYVGVVEESSSVACSFTGSGAISRVCVEEGQRVRKGQLVAQLDETQAGNMVQAAQASVRQAYDARERLRQLHESNSLPDMKWVEIQSQVEQAEAQLQLARKHLAECSIYAPTDGVVGKKMLNAGETALPSMPVLTILDIDNVKVKISIPEKEIAGIGASTASMISVDALGDRTFKGGTIVKGVQADVLTHTYDIKINVDNAEGLLLPGMVAKVCLEGISADSGSFVTVPVRSVQQSADGRLFVWTFADGRANRRNITTGQTSGDRIAVTSGLNIGDKVITSGYQKVSEGSPVTVQAQ